MRSKKVNVVLLAIAMLFVSIPVEALESNGLADANGENITVNDNYAIGSEKKETTTEQSLIEDDITDDENIIYSEPKEKSILENNSNVLSSTVLNGWNYENGNTYYYVNGEKVHGFYDIGGKTYFFGVTTGKLLTGWQELNEGRFYLYSDGSIKEGWQEIEGNRYYVRNNFVLRGFNDVEGVTYYFGASSGKLMTGWQETSEGRFYLYSDGSIKEGWQEIEGKTYYVKDNFVLRGKQEIEGLEYEFDKQTGVLQEGKQVTSDNKIFFIDDKGNRLYGWQEVEGERYYVGDDGFAVHGFKEIEGKTYFLGITTGKLLTGWQELDEGRFYLYSDGTVKEGWQNIDGKTYYVKDNYILRGFHEIEGKTYFFGITTGKLLTGWQEISEGRFYLYSDGSLFMNPGFQKIENKTYYFENNYVVRGYKKIEGDTYYFDSKTGEFRTGFYVINCNEYYYNQYGILTKIQYIPIYYSQQDYRWAWTYYGNENMKSSGCGPTSMAMAFERILGRTILPIDVAYYLYNYTNEFNKEVAGTSGLALQYAANHFGVKWQGISSKNQLIEALNSGKIIYAVVGAGKFTVYPLTHSIVLYKYDNGNTIALDPYNSNKNGYVSVDTIWNEQTTNSYDLRGGYAFYALG